ncbi:SAM-dependent methyltransferase [Actinomadura macra]|uniref:SAM-dependent methyltransferase n=1 Tax=Actinomadura macra TaxID=46164 RepID=UPI000A03ED58
MLVLAHARALLTSTPEGRTAYVDADMHEPDHILDRAQETPELSRPVAITMLGVFWHIMDDAEASRIMGRLLARVPSTLRPRPSSRWTSRRPTAQPGRSSPDATGRAVERYSWRYANPARRRSSRRRRSLCSARQEVEQVGVEALLVAGDERDAV